MSGLRVFCILILFASSLFCFGQLDHQYWHFGSTNRGLFFDGANSYSVTVTTNSYTPYGNEGSTTITDPTTGILKFYSDGMRVIDNTHQLMPNGNGLLGHSSNFSSGRACQVPGNCNQFYVFSVNFAIEDGTPGFLRYSIVDMTLPGNGTIGSPLGDVVAGQKNILIGGNASEALEIIPKANSHDFWLLMGREDINSIEVYSVTSGGISFSSIYALPIVMNNIVCMDHCQQNGKIAFLSYQEMYPTLIADFDNALGTFSPPTIIPGTPWGASTLMWQGTFDCEWSPDGTKLYISKYRWGATAGGRLYQYDLNTPLVAPIMIHSVGASNSAVARGIKLAPDGKIYMMYKPASGASQFLHVVNNPNIAGVGCNFVADVINMGIDLGISHLFPDFLYYANTIPPIPDTTLNFACQLPPIISFNPLNGYADNEGDNLSFIVNSAIGGTFNVVGSTINFTTDPGFIGTPQIEIIYSDDFCYALSDTFLVDLSVTIGTGNLNMPALTNACIGSSIQLDAGSGFLTYLWSTGEITQTIDVISNGQYFVETTDGACIYYDTTFVQFNVPTPVNIGPDQNLCADSLMLTTGVFNGTITWSDGFVGEDNWVLVSSEYSVIAEDVNGCFSYDTVDIVLNPLPQINLGPDLNLCTYDEVYLEAIGFTSVLWNDGSSNDTLFVNQNGNYNVVVTNAFGCNSSDNINLSFSIPQQVDIGPDVTVCNVSYLISSTGFSGSLLWSDGGVGATNLISVSGVNSVIGTDVNGCISYDTIDVFLAPIPAINLGGDTTICPSGMILDATGFSTVIWSDGSTNPTLEILNPGIYSVEVANAFGCIAGDLVEIAIHDPSSISLGPDYETCNKNEVTILTGIEDGDFLWSTGSTQSQITVSETGTYTIEQSLCDTIIRDTIFIEISTLDQVVYIPNAFTPDGNGSNNEFKIFFGDYSHVLKYSLSIYDRWGGVIYSTNNPYATWDGTYTQGLVQDGIYVYVVKIETDCEENQLWVKTGHVTVLK